MIGLCSMAMGSTGKVRASISSLDTGLQDGRALAAALDSVKCFGHCPQPLPDSASGMKFVVHVVMHITSVYTTHQYVLM